MKRLLTVLLAVSALAASCSRGRDAGERAPELRSVSPSGSVDSAGTVSRPRIVFLGDSLSAGYGVTKEQSIPSLVQKHLDAEGYNYEVVNQGVSGDTSAGGVSRLDWSLGGDVRILVIELGGNDGLRGLPVETTKQNIAQIIKTAKQRGVQVLLTGMEAPPSYGPLYTAEFRQLFRALAREHDVAFMPFFLEGVAGNPVLNQPDGIHPNPEGAVIVEQAVWKSLKPLLEKVRHAEAAQQRRRKDTTGR